MPEISYRQPARILPTIGSTHSLIPKTTVRPLQVETTTGSLPSAPTVWPASPGYAATSDAVPELFPLLLAPVRDDCSTQRDGPALNRMRFRHIRCISIWPASHS